MRPAFAPSSPAVEALEQQLKVSLRPVQPDREFVDHLHSRLTTPSLTIIERRESVAFSLLLVAGALLFGIFFVWLMRQFRHRLAD